MTREGGAQTKDAAVVLYNNDPPRRSKSNVTMAQMLDLPDEILACIFEYFAAPMVRGPVHQESCFLVSAGNLRTMSRLSLVSKRIAKVALPLIWRHLCDEHYIAVYRSVLYFLRNSHKSSTLSKKRRLLTSSLQLVTTLSLDWRMDSSTESEGDDLINPEIIRSCKQLCYLRLLLRYSKLSNNDSDGGSEDGPGYFSVLRLRLALMDLRFIKHLDVRLTWVWDDDGDEDAEDLLNSPLEKCLSDLFKIRLDSLEGLTIGGLAAVTDVDNTQIGAKTCFKTSFNYRALKMVRFEDEPPREYVRGILDRLLTVASVQMLSFGETSMISEVPPAMRPHITSLDLESAGDLDPQLLPSFPSLQSLSCKVEHIGNPSTLSHHNLQKLTLTDMIPAVFGWVKECLSQVDYLPNLRYLHINIVWTRTLAEDRISLSLEVPRSREIAMHIEYEYRPSCFSIDPLSVI